MRRTLAWFDNPLFLKETRLLFRSPKTPLLHFGYLLVLGCGATAFAWFAHLTAESGDPSALWRMGAGCFKAAYALHLAVVGLFAASMASVAISSERERRTWDLLAALPMGPAQLLAGKFLAVFTAAAILVCSSLPLWLFTLSVIGGVTPGEMAASFLAILGFAALSASFGLLASTLFEDSRKSFGLAFRVLLLVGGTGVACKAAWALHQPNATRYIGYGGPSLGEFLGNFGQWLPAPESSAGSLGLFLACALLSVPILTLAVDELKPADERRPDRLNRQLCALSGFAFAAYFAWAVFPWETGRHAPSSAPLPGTPFVLLSALQGTLLVLLSLAVLPAEPRSAGSLFDGGPRRGGALLLGALALTGLPVAALAAWAGPAAPAGWLASEIRLAFLLVLCASLARVCLAWKPSHARAAYLGGLLFLTTIPGVCAALLGDPVRSLALRVLELNPVVGAALLDKTTVQWVAREFPQTAPGAPWEAPALALLLTLALAALGTALGTTERARGMPVPAVWR